MHTSSSEQGTNAVRSIIRLPLQVKQPLPIESSLEFIAFYLKNDIVVFPPNDHSPLTSDLACQGRHVRPFPRRLSQIRGTCWSFYRSHLLPGPAGHSCTKAYTRALLRQSFFREWYSRCCCERDSRCISSLAGAHCVWMFSTNSLFPRRVCAANLQVCLSFESNL